MFISNELVHQDETLPAKSWRRWSERVNTKPFRPNLGDDGVNALPIEADEAINEYVRTFEAI